MESDADSNAVEGGTRRAKEGGYDISGALVVVTLTLNKGAMTMDVGATTGPTNVASALTSATEATS